MSVQTFFFTLYNDTLKFYHSPAFSVIKFLLGIYAIVIIADIILLVIQRGFSADIRETFTGMRIPRALTSKRKNMRQKWEKIRERIKDHAETEYKVAIIEADDIIDSLIKGLGYKGENMGERLAKIPDAQIPNIEGLKQAHECRNRIIHDENFVLSREEVEKIMHQYEEFLRHFQVID